MNMPSRRARLVSHIPAVVLLALVITLTYFPAFQMDLISYDVLNHLEFVQHHGPFDAFFPGPDTVALYRAQVDCCVYRPIFALQVWTLYQLFSFNHTGFQAALIGLHFLSTTAVYALFITLGFRRSLSLLFAAFFSVHQSLLEPVIWLSDAYLWLVPITCLTLILLRRPSPSRGSGLAVIGLTLAAPLVRENGLAVPICVLIYGLLAWRLGLYPSARLRQLGMQVLIGLLVYFVLRVLTVGIAPHDLDPSRIDIIDIQSLPAGGLRPLQSVAVYALTILVNFMAVFFPVFDYTGFVRPYVIAGLVMLSIVFGLLWIMLRRRTFASAAPVTSSILPSITILITAFLVISVPLKPVLPAADIARHALQCLLSLGILIGVWQTYRQWTPQQQILAVFALCLIITSSGLAFLNFRYRNLVLPLLGWLILLGIILSQSAHAPLTQYFKRAAPILLTGALALNIIFTNQSLPWGIWQIKNYEVSPLCHGQTPERTVLEVAAYYGLDPADIRACRAAFSPD